MLAAPPKPHAAQVRRINPLLDESWDQFVALHPAATLFHRSAWARVLAETYHYQPFYFASDHEHPAVLCAFEIDSWITGRRGISLPFTDEARLLDYSDLSQQRLFDFAVKVGVDRKWKSFELRGCDPRFEQDSSLSFFSHSLDLTVGENELFSNCDGSVRRAIRKAERSKLSFRVQASFEAVREYYELHCLTRRKHGLPPQPFLFFQNIYRHLISQGLGFIAFASIGNRPAAAALFLNDNKRAHYKFGASNPQFDDLRPNNFVMWNAIRHCGEKGLELLDFGRTSLHNEGLRRYKLNWGAHESKLCYLKRHCTSGQWLRDVDRSSGTKNAFFRLLPPTLNRVLGALLYPHIA